jgi:uncharacterized protein
MNTRFNVLISTVLFMIFWSTASFSVQPPVPKMPSGYVVDLANIIGDNYEMSLKGYLQELEQKTTVQMVILTINDLEGESIFDLSLSIAHDKWKLGQKGKDNGVLLMVSLKDRKYWTQVGYGLEGVLPDSLVGSIGRQYLVPYFKEGDYSKGITAASLAVINEIASDSGVEITGMPKLKSRSRYPYSGMKPRKPTLLGGIFTILFFIGLIYLFIKHPRLLLFLLFMNMLGGGRRSHWGGGGGFGGGGFGSFGGGGGGGFGGGGAGGGW